MTGLQPVDGAYFLTGYFWITTISGALVALFLSIWTR